MAAVLAHRRAFVVLCVLALGSADSATSDGGTVLGEAAGGFFSGLMTSGSFTMMQAGRYVEPLLPLLAVLCVICAASVQASLFPWLQFRGGTGPDVDDYAHHSCS